MRYLFRVLAALVILHAGLAFSSVYIGNIGPEPFYGQDGNLLNPQAQSALASNQSLQQERPLSQVTATICQVTTVVGGLWGLITLSGYTVVDNLPEDGAWNWIRGGLGVIGLFLSLGLVATLLDLAQRMGRLGYALGIVSVGAAALGVSNGLNALLNCNLT